MPFLNFIRSKNPVPIHAIYLMQDKSILCELGQKDVRIQPKSQIVCVGPNCEFTYYKKYHQQHKLHLKDTVQIINTDHQM